MAPSLSNSTTKVAAHVCDPYIIPLMYTHLVHEAIHSIGIAVLWWQRPQHQPGTCVHVNRPRVIFGMLQLQMGAAGTAMPVPSAVRDMRDMCETAHAHATTVPP